MTDFIIAALIYAKAVLKFAKLNTVAQQREAVTRGRSLLPYRLRYNGRYLVECNKGLFVIRFRYNV
ncbi:MAG: hypothetical protein LBK06_02530 [Planctomycetaceae bacterium]|nr:hypothetical protein [Planctomycetaceae bacterium]